eukprot:184877_1
MSQQGEIQKWARDQENLDIYQICSFIIGTTQRKYYPIVLWKVLACIGLQLPGIIFLTQSTYEGAGFHCANVNICQGYNGATLTESWMAFFFVSFVSIVCAEDLRNLGNYGMYQWGSNQPEFVSKIWVAIGFYANLITLVLSWLCSSIIIFASKDIIEMVLNSVAVLFMITIDDEIVGFSDYENVTTMFGSYSAKNKASAWLDKVAEGLMKIQVIWDSKRTVICGKPCEVCTFIMTPLTIVAPLFTIMCYGMSAYDEDCNLITEEAP